jgi:hypothetical protein
MDELTVGFTPMLDGGVGALMILAMGLGPLFAVGSAFAGLVFCTMLFPPGKHLGHFPSPLSTKKRRPQVYFSN